MSLEQRPNLIACFRDAPGSNHHRFYVMFINRGAVSPRTFWKQQTCWSSTGETSCFTYVIIILVWFKWIQKRNKTPDQKKNALCNQILFIYLSIYYKHFLCVSVCWLFFCRTSMHTHVSVVSPWLVWNYPYTPCICTTLMRKNLNNEYLFMKRAEAVWNSWPCLQHKETHCLQNTL